MVDIYQDMKRQGTNPARHWPYRNRAGNWGEFQSLSSR